jgi:hypothetical protein
MHDFSDPVPESSTAGTASRGMGKTRVDYPSAPASRTAPTHVTAVQSKTVAIVFVGFIAWVSIWHHQKVHVRYPNGHYPPEDVCEELYV